MHVIGNPNTVESGIEVYVLITVSGKGYAVIGWTCASSNMSTLCTCEISKVGPATCICLCVGACCTQSLYRQRGLQV